MYILKIHIKMDREKNINIDVNEFSRVVKKQLDIARKQINGCDEAFESIEKALDILENNFDGYYKDVIRNQNSSSMMEKFILDITKSQEYDAKITQQLKRIFRFYRRKEEIKDPKLKKLLDVLNGIIL